MVECVQSRLAPKILLLLMVLAMGEYSMTSKDGLCHKNGSEYFTRQYILAILQSFQFGPSPAFISEKLC